MFKNSVLFMSAMVVGLSLVSTADAQKKNQKEVESGPMDKYVTRASGPKLVITKKNKKPIKFKTYTPRDRSHILSATERAEQNEKMAYLMGLAGFTEDLTPMQRAWLTKI